MTRGRGVDAAEYDAVKERAAARSRAQSKAGRDIAPLPDIKDPERKARAARDFRFFCETYFPLTFHLAWSPDHLKIIGRIEEAVLKGGLFALATPRGLGKTTLCERACIWAILYGHRRFVVLIGSGEKHARDMLSTIKMEFETNDGLLDDFPEAIYPIRRIEGIANRCKGQVYNGKRTYIEWTKDSIILPTIGGSAASAATLRVTGITGRIRGMKQQTAAGTAPRPDLVILDDPQTDEPLSVDTPIPTPGGFVRMGDLCVGDEAFDEQGKACHVTATSTIMDQRECYRITFDDGATIVADSDHKWLTSTALQRTNQRRKKANPDPSRACRPQCRAKPFASIVTTKHIGETVITAKDNRSNHSIPLTAPIAGADTCLPIPSYTLGAWLANGDSAAGRITTPDLDVIRFIETDGFFVGRPKRKVRAAGAYTVHGLVRLLRASGLLSNKHVPDGYWFASQEARLALLQGLMDGDGSITAGRRGVKGTRCTFSNTNPQLIEAVLHLCRSFGIKAKRGPTFSPMANAKPGWRVTFITSLPVFRLPRKQVHIPCETRPDTRRRYVVSVNQVHSRPVRCIEVDSPSHLYLCGHDLIPTHNSARSLTQCDSREILLAGAILNLAGPQTKISGIMPCTVICPGDMADRILDRKKHPDWRGERMKLIYSFPSNMALWDKYAEVQAGSLEAGGDGSEATEFYEAHRAEMDAGAQVAWDEYFEPGEVSALQHGMNLKFTSDRAHDGVFWAEYQNEPQLAYGDPDVAPKLLPDNVFERTNNRKRAAVPEGCEQVTAYIDIQERLLYYLVAAWRADFTGYVIDYGTYPEQPTGAFTARGAPRTLKLAHRGAGTEGAVYAGLEHLTEKLLAQEWRRDDGVVMHIGRCLVDAGWLADVVYDFCRQSVHAAVLMPAHGAGIGASQKPVSEYDRKRGDTIGEGWWIPASTRKRALRHLRIDTNYWKTFIYERITTAIGDKGALTIFGGKPQAHRLLADHLCAEYRVRTEGRGRKLDEWKNPAHQPDNHWWDGLVGSAAAASMLGSRLTGAPPKRRKSSGVPLAERWRLARERDGRNK